jgi:hypothetical protein
VNNGQFFNEPTLKQLNYVAVLQKKLGLSDAALDLHCENRFDRPFLECSRAQVSALIDQLVTWKTVPDDLRRAMGQLDLFAPGGAS